MLFPDTRFDFRNKITWHYQATIKFEQQKVTPQWDTLDKKHLTRLSRVVNYLQARRRRIIELGEFNLKFSKTSCALDTVCCVRLMCLAASDNAYSHKCMHSNMDGGIVLLFGDRRCCWQIYLNRLRYGKVIRLVWNKPTPYKPVSHNPVWFCCC
jgi:hypothetical protein